MVAIDGVSFMACLSRIDLQATSSGPVPDWHGRGQFQLFRKSRGDHHWDAPAATAGNPGRSGTTPDGTSHSLIWSLSPDSAIIYLAGASRPWVFPGARVS
jgi:hypothetical protein